LDTLFSEMHMPGASMSTTIPPSVQPVVDAYLRLTTITLPGFLTGFYLHGSLALGAFNPRFSDIDFITIASRPCTPSDITCLRTIHQTIAHTYPQWPLEGSYLQWRDLGRFEETISPHPYHHDGILHPGGHHDMNAVTWWVLKHRGIAIIGPSPDQLDIHVDWDDLLATMHHNLNSYWASFTTIPRRMAWLLTDYGIQWAVLGVLRQFYTFREHAITSKEGAGIYALDHTPRQWHPLIQEALTIRAGTGATSYRFRIARAITARAFLQYIIAACNADSA
jgi:hypothetical protein